MRGLEHTSYDMNAYKLHIINTDKFKTITVSVAFRRKIVKEEITIRNLIKELVINSSFNYPTERSLIIETERLYDLKLREQEAANQQERKSKIGTGDRSEKIRTYNYPQNRVTDHRIGFTSMNLDRIMAGDLGVIIDALINEDQKRKLENSEI